MVKTKSKIFSLVLDSYIQILNTKNSDTENTNFCLVSFSFNVLKTEISKIRIHKTKPKIPKIRINN